MRRRRSIDRSDRRFTIVTALWLASTWGGVSVVHGEDLPLQLEVDINGTPSGLIGSFVKRDDGRIAATRSELVEIGLEPPKRAQGDLVALDDLPGVSYRYDASRQALFVIATDAARRAKRYSLSPRPEAPTEIRSDYGAVVNYDIFSTTADVSTSRNLSLGFGGSSVWLDGRGFSPYGTIGQSAIFRHSEQSGSEALRLDTTFTHVDPETALAYRAGDTITGGLAWTRPIRIAGVQVQRNFSVRPDLITIPLPGISGSAAVPTTADIYIDNVRTTSQGLDGGPFHLVDIPVVSGGGDVRIVLRDAAGHETVTEKRFYATQMLLRPGLTDFSIEAGAPRVSYASPSDRYLPQSVASASLRHGVYDWLTLEGHAEGGASLVNAGAGASVSLAGFGVASLALAGSRNEGAKGMQAFGSVETKIAGFQLTAAAQRTFGRYRDLASIAVDPSVPVTTSSAWPWSAAPLPPRRMERLTVGLPAFAFDPKSSFAFNWTHLVDGKNDVSRIFGASWSRALPRDATISATAFADVGDRRNIGAFVAFSMPLGKIATTTQVSGTSSGTSVGYQAVRPLGEEIGSYGWRVQETEGSVAYRSAELGYRGALGEITVGAASDRVGARGTAELKGSIAWIGGEFHAANRIDDAFAVVRTGYPGVPVSYENRPIGRTGADGSLLVPSLRSYQPNRLSIDPTVLPVGAEAPESRQVITPGLRSGVVADFRVRTAGDAAIVSFVDVRGHALPPGTAGALETGETFVVGYDGEGYVRGLRADNIAVLRHVGGECRAAFTFRPIEDAQVRLGPISCR